MKSLRTLAVAAAVGSILAGCGGTNGGFFDPAPLPPGGVGDVSKVPPAPIPGQNDPPLTDAPAPTPPPATIEGVGTAAIAPSTGFRFLRPGDYWQYYVTGRLTTQVIGGANPSQNSRSITGTLTKTITTEIFDGQPVLKLTNRFVYNPQGGLPVTEVEELYLDQDGAANITLLARRHTVGDNNVRIFARVTETAFVQPGQWQPLTSASGQTDFVNDPSSPQENSRMNDTLTVTGSKDIATGLGRYGTWKTERSTAIEYTFGDPVGAGQITRGDEAVAATEYWVPAIGSYVYRKTNTTRVWDVVDTFSPLTFRQQNYTFTTFEVLVSTTVQ
ncbi:MAG TPA: hypothetical protein PLH94_03435 [Fimbriimonadaceae bacterium]|nr:hypothetical protein [Fimbriimonadaceae bacterium]